MIFAAGTGNPYFTTDTTAALRAAEIGAEAILKGTHSGVDGVYSADPRLDPDAAKLTRGQPLRGANRGLKVMDSTAITFCMDNELPIIVFDVMEPGNIRRALVGEPIGTLVSTSERGRAMAVTASDDDASSGRMPRRRCARRSRTSRTSSAASAPAGRRRRWSRS